jgi:hypothetical protein
MAEGVQHGHARKTRLNRLRTLFPFTDERRPTVFDKFGHDDEGSEDPGDAPEADMIPTVEDPSERLRVESPSVRDYSEVDADPELQKEFWSQVLLFNIALFCLSLGVMLVVFRGQWTLGGGLFAVGLFAFGRGYRRYRTVQKD